MELFLAAILLVALCVFGLCFNIIFRKDGKFPETEIENNREMRKRGIKCAKEEEIKIWGKKDKDGKGKDDVKIDDGQDGTQNGGAQTENSQTDNSQGDGE